MVQIDSVHNRYLKRRILKTGSVSSERPSHLKMKKRQLFYFRRMFSHTSKQLAEVSQFFAVKFKRIGGNPAC